MMDRKDKEFDNWLANKAGKAEPEFREEYWLRAQKMIDAGRRRQTVMKPYLASFILGLLLMVTGVILFTDNRKMDGTSVKISQPEKMGRGDLTDPSTKPLLGNDISSALQPIAPANGAVSEKSALASSGTAAPKYQASQIQKPVLPQNKQSLIFAKESGVLPVNDTVQNPESEFESTEVSNAVKYDLTRLKGINVSIPFKQAGLSCDTCSPVRLKAYNDTKKYRNSGYLFASLLFNHRGFETFSPDRLAFEGGLFYRYNLPGRFFLETGLGFVRLNQDLGSRSYVQTRYSFGKEQKVIRLTTTSLDYLQLPVMTGFRISDKHKVLIGLRYLYLINTTEQVKEETSGELTTIKKSVQHGYFDAAGSSDIQVCAGYEFTPFARLSFSAGAYYGFKDVSVNRYYLSNTYSNNKGLRLGVSYKIR